MSTYAARIETELQALGKVPAPDADAIAHSERLDQYLSEQARAQGGHLRFDHFMEAVLYAPGLGYYAAGSAKFGDSGDFITAPEISPLFGQSIAQQVAQVLRECAGDVLEFGAGTGAMAADILQYLESIGCLPQHYYIVERSADLKQRQAETLQQRCPTLAAQVCWLDQLPDNFVGVMLGNEVVDALPIRLWCTTETGLNEYFVTADDEGWHLSQRPPTAELKRWYDALPVELKASLPVDYVSEANLIQADWLRALAASLQQGLILLLDYGFPQREYYHPQRHGTLMCHYRHFAHTAALSLLGLQDITAHVDFTALSETALEVGLNVGGYTDQATFLTNCGILEQMEAAAGGDAATLSRYSQQLKLLLMPSEMGELFKVVGYTRGLENMPLCGFSRGDRRTRL